MKQLTNKCIITFPSTVAALAMEKACAETNTPGRLIPVPTKISAGCGLCWCAEPCDQEVCLELIRSKQLVYEAVHQI